MVCVHLSQNKASHHKTEMDKHKFINKGMGTLMCVQIAGKYFVLNFFPPNPSRRLSTQFNAFLLDEHSKQKCDCLLERA